MYCTVRYYVRSCDQTVYLIGESGGPTTQERIIQLVSGQDPLLIQALANDYDIYLRNNNHIQPEDGSVVNTYFEHDNNGIIINLWLAKDGPMATCTYLGSCSFVVAPGKLRGVKSEKSHCFDLYMGASFVPPEENLHTLLKQFRELEAVVPDNHIIRFMMYQDDKYLPPYIYGYFKPIDEVTMGLESLNKCPSDCYCVEISHLTKAWYFTIKKEDYHSGIIELLSLD